MKHRLSIDPGFGDGTGWALWREDEWNKCVPPVDFGIIKVRGGAADWVNRCLILGEQLAPLFHRGIRTVYCEFPGLFASSAGSHMSVSKGDIPKLCFLVGVYASVAAYNDSEFVSIGVNQWKGTMSKDAVAARIGKRLHEEPYSYPSHSNDAVGIGLYAKGVF